MSNVCIIQSGGLLDNLVTQFGNVAVVWQTQINPLARNIFFILFGMEFMWQLTVQKIFAGDIEKLWVFFFTRSITGLFFAKYIVNVNLYKGVIAYFVQLASNLSGFALNLTPGNNFLNLGPSEVIENFACLAAAVHKITDTTGSFDYLTLKVTLAIIQVVLFITLALIAYNLMKVILQAYFILYIGFFLTGFIGSSWTTPFWYSYIDTVAKVAIKFLAVCFILGVTATQISTWATEFNAATNVYQLAAAVLQATGIAIIIALLSYQFPEWAAASLTSGMSTRQAQLSMSGD